MKTLAKVLLIVFWFLGAGTGWPSPSTAPSSEASTYHIALMEGVDAKVNGHRVTLQVTAGWGAGLSMSAAVPGWVAALSSRLHGGGASPTIAATPASLPPTETTPLAP